MQSAFEDTCRSLLMELDLLKSDQAFDVLPLTGGVASDIALVQIGERKLCVKFALPRLKVQADWFAPVHRNTAEYAWLEVVSDIAPDCAVRLLGRSRHMHGFAMEFLEGDDTYLWKNALLAEAPDQGEAQMVGKLIGRVHAASTHENFNARLFQNRDDFLALRIEPYLTYSASRHSDIAVYLNQIAAQLYGSNQVLSHGDVSPKNIFFRDKRPVFLDAECASMGDSSFDPSFCLNHLVLKAIHLPRSRDRYLANAMQLWQAYSLSVSWEAVPDLEVRVCSLLPALMLARIDGKSPVEYLRDHERKIVRAIARQLIKSPINRLDELIQYIGKSSGNSPT